jgi:hypothetical protein
MNCIYHNYDYNYFFKFQALFKLNIYILIDFHIVLTAFVVVFLLFLYFNNFINTFESQNKKLSTVMIANKSLLISINCFFVL